MANKKFVFTQKRRTALKKAQRKWKAMGTSARKKARAYGRKYRGTAMKARSAHRKVARKYL